MVLNDKIEYEIELYEDSAGNSDIDDFLNNLATKALKSKDARIQFRIRKNKYILLHHFIKKTQKTPRREIKKKKKEMKDYIEREDKNENLENI